MISIVAQPMFCAMLSTVGDHRPAAAEQSAQRHHRRRAGGGAEHRRGAEQQRAEAAADDDGGMARPHRAGGRGDQRPGQRAEQADPEVAPEGQLVEEAERPGRLGGQDERRLDCAPATGSGGASGSEVTDMTRSLRRHYPVRFGRSADPRLTHSALSAHLWCELPKVDLLNANTSTARWPTMC